MSIYYAIAVGCNKVQPYYLAVGTFGQVVEHVNKRVGDGFSLLEHRRIDELDIAIDEDEDRYIFTIPEDEDRYIYTIPKKGAQKLFPDCSCFAEVYLYKQDQGFTDLEALMNEVREMIV